MTYPSETVVVMKNEKDSSNETETETLHQAGTAASNDVIYISSDDDEVDTAKVKHEANLNTEELLARALKENRALKGHIKSLQTRVLDTHYWLPNASSTMNNQSRVKREDDSEKEN